VATIQITDRLRSDPRFETLCTLIPRHIAFGSLVRAWEVGLSYWRNDRALIPLNIGDLLPSINELVLVGLIDKTDDGYFCKGAAEHWDFLHRIKDARRKAGLKSAEQRKLKDGTAIPFNAANRKPPNKPENSPNTKPNKTDVCAEHTELLSSPLLSFKDSSLNSPDGELGKPPKKIHWLAELWNQNCGQLPKVQAVSSQREKKIKAALREYGDDRDEWVQVISRMLSSSFLTGKNERGWRADFDFFIKAETRLRVMEGKYDSKGAKPFKSQRDLTGTDKQAQELFDSITSGKEENERDRQ
jgi:hypothetical protein